MAGYLNLPQSQLDYLSNTYVNPAIQGFNNEMNIFICENLAMGISNTNLTQLVADTMADVQRYGSTGSLYTALDALNAIQVTPEMAPFITQPRLDYLKSRIVAILSSL